MDPQDTQAKHTQFTSWLEGGVQGPQVEGACAAGASTVPSAIVSDTAPQLIWGII